MAVKIRLARRGRKKLALYDVVVADARSPRDGRYIEKLGTFNPNTDPVTVDINDDKALEWIMKGAKPTDSARTLLSRKGVMLRKHLQIGVQKGAITQEEADKRFQVWIKDKESKEKANTDKINKKKAEETKSRLETERKIKEARSEALIKKQAALAEAETAAVAAPEGQAVVESAETVSEVQDTTEAAVTANSEHVKEESPAEIKEPPKEEPAEAKSAGDESAAGETATEATTEAAAEEKAKAESAGDKPQETTDSNKAEVTEAPEEEVKEKPVIEAGKVEEQKAEAAAGDIIIEEDKGEIKTEGEDNSITDESAEKTKEGKAEVKAEDKAGKKTEENAEAKVEPGGQDTPSEEKEETGKDTTEAGKK